MHGQQNIKTLQNDFMTI